MSVSFTKGKYYVGDPCYVISDEHWDELLDKTNFFEDGEFKFKGATCFTANTAFGDGTYEDQEGREYCVDAGLIGVIPFEVLDENFEGSGGQIIEFDEEFTASETDGSFFIGDIVIITGDSDDDDEEFDEEFNDDEDGCGCDCGCDGCSCHDKD